MKQKFDGDSLAQSQFTRVDETGKSSARHFHNPVSSPLPSHFYDRGQHKIPPMEILFALRNKKGRRCEELSYDNLERAGVIPVVKVARTLSPVCPCSKNKGTRKMYGQEWGSARKNIVGETAVTKWRKDEKNVNYELLGEEWENAKKGRKMKLMRRRKGGTDGIQDVSWYMKCTMIIRCAIRYTFRGHPTKYLRLGVLSRYRVASNGMYAIATTVRYIILSADRLTTAPVKQANYDEYVASTTELSKTFWRNFSSNSFIRRFRRNSGQTCKKVWHIRQNFHWNFYRDRYKEDVSLSLGEISKMAGRGKVVQRLSRRRRGRRFPVHHGSDLFRGGWIIEESHRNSRSANLYPRTLLRVPLVWDSCE